MDISVFLQLPDPNRWVNENTPKSSIARQVLFYDGNDLEDGNLKLALVGVKDGRQSSGNEDCKHGPDKIREELFKLFKPDEMPATIDLGNIDQGNEVSDTLYALNQVCQYLMKKNIIPVILGGGQGLTYANYLAYEGMEQTVNLVTIDSHLNFGASPNSLDSQGYLNSIVLHKPNFLFNYSNIGHQRYLVDPEILDLLGKMYFDTARLGEVQGNLQIAEPILRNADMVSFDVSSIRKSEAPGNANGGPNGFYGDEAAQLCRYAGMSDKLTAFGIYEYNPTFDRDAQTAQLIAQMIWCFMEGVSHRKGDYPKGDYSEYQRYIVGTAAESHELVFYKSPKTDRWWMDVPYPAGQNNKFERHHLVPCTYEEYLQAANDEMPDRWWRTYQKLV